MVYGNFTRDTILSEKKKKTFFSFFFFFVHRRYITNPPTWMQHERRDRDDTGQRGPTIHRERHPLWRSHGPVWIVRRSCHCSPILCPFSTLHTHTRRRKSIPHPLQFVHPPGHDDGTRRRRRRRTTRDRHVDRDPGRERPSGMVSRCRSGTLFSTFRAD